MCHLISCWPKHPKALPPQAFEYKPRAQMPPDPAFLSLQAQPLLQSPPKLSSAEVDVGLLFQQASLKSTAEADPFFSHWHLRWADQAAIAAAAGSGQAGVTEGVAPVLAWHPCHTANAAVPALDAWDGLYLESTVDWPLQLLFPPEVSG